MYRSEDEENKKNLAEGVKKIKSLWLLKLDNRESQLQFSITVVDVLCLLQFVMCV